MTLENKTELILIRNILYEEGLHTLLHEKFSEEEIDNIEANMMLREVELTDKFVQQYK